MTAKIFTYKGYLAADIDMRNGKFINNLEIVGDQIKTNGNLGCVISTTEIEITQEAIDQIKSAPREGGSFAELMLTKHADGSGSSVGILGFGKVLLGNDFSIGRDCDLEVLNDCTIVEIEIPEDFKNFIDGNADEDEEETEESEESNEN